MLKSAIAMTLMLSALQANASAGYIKTPPPPEAKVHFAPLSLALTCSKVTPVKNRVIYPQTRSASDLVCIDRRTLVGPIRITEIDRARDRRFQPSVYEIIIYVADADRARMDAAFARAGADKTLAFVVNEHVVSVALVTTPPSEGRILLGGYDSAAEASAVLEEFVAAHASEDEPSLRRR